VNTIGIVCVGLPAKLAENERTINQRIAKLLHRYPEAIFVCLERKSDRFTQDALEMFGVTPTVLHMDESWRRVETVKVAGEFQGKQYEPGDKVTLYDHRKQMRDSELVRVCDRVLVFAPRGSSGHWQDFVKKAAAKRERFPSWPQTVFLAEYGEAPPKKAKARRATKRQAREYA
jgi:hypothetical protein